MYAAAGGASLAGRKARQHGRQPAPPSPDPLHPAPTGVRAYSCQHWESLLSAPPPPPRPVSEPHSPCEIVECAAGRAAWQEAAALSVGGGGAGAGGAARRCSVLGDHPGARRSGKWHRNNRVRDASYGSSSDSDGEADAINGEPWGVARLLYAGLGILALGLVVYFVGTGDKGFKTPALRLVGPSLIFAGLGLCLLRIAFCIFAKPCCRRRTNYKENRRLSGCVEGEEMPLAGGTSRGPAQCSPARRLDASSCDVSSLSSGEEDERLRRYRTASHHTLQPPPQNIQVAPCQGSSNVRQTPSPQSPLQPGAVSPTEHATLRPIQRAPSVPLKEPCVTQREPCVTQRESCITQREPCVTQIEPSVPQSALHGPSQRRPPPRNVSFASGPDGELVLSPAQLRS